MKKLILSAILMIAAVTANAALPTVKVETMDSKSVSFADVAKDKVVLISFWSTTCKPCLMELDAIADQLQDWQDEVDFEVIAVSTDDARSVQRARTMAEAKDWGFTVVFDVNQELKRAMQVSVTPQTFIYDAKGNVVSSHSGYTPGSEYTLFEELLEIK